MSLDVAKLISGSFYVAAIDPGMSGAVASLGFGRVSVARDFKSLASLSVAVSSHSTASRFTVIEQVHAMPGQGVCSMFSFGKSTGAAFGACYAGGAEIIEVSPQKWQNFFRKTLGIAKGTAFNSREIAAGLLPAWAHFFERKKDHNSADAVLMGLWFLAQPKLTPTI